MAKPAAVVSNVVFVVFVVPAAILGLAKVAFVWFDYFLTPLARFLFL